MTTEAETIFVSPDGDAGQEHELVPSLSIANLLQQREAVLTLFHEALDKLEQAHALATAARLGFPDLSMARGWRGNGFHMTGEFANRTTLLETFQACVDAGGWTTLLHDSGMRSIMSASKRKEVDEQIGAEQVPELTRDAIRATFATLHDSRADMFETAAPICGRPIIWTISSASFISVMASRRLITGQGRIVSLRMRCRRVQRGPSSPRMIMSPFGSLRITMGM